MAAPGHPKKRGKRRAAYKTVTDTHRIPVAPSPQTAVKNLYKALEDIEKVETELLTVRAALRHVRPNKTKPKAKHAMRGLRGRRAAHRKIRLR